MERKCVAQSIFAFCLSNIMIVASDPFDLVTFGVRIIVDFSFIVIVISTFCLANIRGMLFTNRDLPQER